MLKVVLIGVLVFYGLLLLILALGARKSVQCWDCGKKRSFCDCDDPGAEPNVKGRHHAPLSAISGNEDAGIGATRCL